MIQLAGSKLGFELAKCKEKCKMNLAQRFNVILGSVVTLVTALAVAVNEFVATVAPELPSGWQDSALRIGTAIVSVLAAAALAIRRVTEVPKEEHGILPPGSH